MREQISRRLFRQFKSIRSAFMLYFSLLIIVALIVFMLISLNHTEQTVMDNSITYLGSIIEQVNNDIDSYIDYMGNISTILVNSSDVQTYLFSTKGIKNLEEEKSRILSQIAIIKDSRDDIANIATVVVDGRNIVNSSDEGINPYVDITEMEWYIDTMEAEDGVNISVPHVQNIIRSSYEWVITLSRTYSNEETGEVEGIFFIDLNYEAISDLCNNNKVGDKGYTFIIDDEGNIIYHPKQQLLYGGLTTENISAILEATENYIITSEGDDSRLYTMSRSEKTGWTVVSVAYLSELLKDSSSTQMLYIFTAFLLILATIIITNIIVLSITNPIQRMRDSMKMVQEGNFTGANIEIVDNNELASLGESFNAMTQRISDLMEQNIYEQKEKRKNEMRVLMAQINPHFLYNTLDSIIWMSAAGKNDEVVEMTSALAKLFRQSISNEKEEYTIQEEIDYVKSYLIIQKMRYNDKVEYSFDVDPKITKIPIIKFALQPLVENAIYHGLKYKEGKGLLHIKGYTHNQKIYLEVKDNGVGMTEEELKYIFDEKQTDYKNNGVGVVNVQSRLKLYYGEEYGIEYRSEKNVGTTATVTVPIDGARSDEVV
ncbi:MAG: sensor histidine kinase [Eubacteriales bacterium]